MKVYKQGQKSHAACNYDECASMQLHSQSSLLTWFTPVHKVRGHARETESRQQNKNMFTAYSIIEWQECFPVNPLVWLWLWLIVLLQSSSLKRLATEIHCFSSSPILRWKNFNEYTIAELYESCQVFQHAGINRDSNFNVIIWELLN